jgi:hypothetical protein
VAKLIEGCEEVVDGSHRGVAIGSRAHLVGSEAVVKVRRYTLSPSLSLSFQKADRMGFELSCCSAPPCETSSCARSTSCS